MLLRTDRRKLSAESFKLAIANNIIEGHLGLGELYSPTLKNLDKKSARHYTIAAKNDNLVAQYIVATHHFSTEGKKSKPERAVKWLRQASANRNIEFLSYEHGPFYVAVHAQAKYLLACHFRNGYKTFIKKDLTIAAGLCNQAIALGSQEAIPLLATLKTLIATQASPSQNMPSPSIHSTT